MMNNESKMREVLDGIRADELNYQEWLRIGMACKTCGLSREEWETWSRNDARFNSNDCRARWNGFNNSVSIATAVFIAKQHGFAVPAEWKANGETVAPRPIQGNAADSYIERIAAYSKALPKLATPLNEADFERMLSENGGLTRAESATAYISALFSDFDVIGLCNSFEYDPETDEKPKFRFERAGTVKQWIANGHDDSYPESLEGLTEIQIAEIKVDHATLPQNILINPVKPNSDNKYNAKTESIASYRHILVESDNMPLYEQFKVLTALNLPISTITYSGNKSLHALVKVDAKTTDEYRNRFEFVRDVCAAYGMQIDEACKNPNRWTRLAGALRRRTTQTLVCIDCGAESWSEWYDDIKARVDNAEYERTLTEFGITETTFAELNANPPETVPHIIQNALKAGREAILIASSKAGKSWLCLKLAVACADGGEWLGYNCNRVNVGIVNMELGADDIFERMRLITGGNIQHPENIHFLNCAGVCSDLEHLQTAIERFAIRNKLDLLIVDPVYSLFGKLEENSNGDVMQFLERLAQIRRNTGCATFMTHHTSKGSQDGKASIDMGSGAGAFARHPDMILTMQTATPENIKGVPAEQLRFELESGIAYFVLNETLRSFKSARKSEIWRADFPDYTRVDSAGYDSMGAAHNARADASTFKYRAAIQECLKNNEPLTITGISARAGVSKQALSKWRKDNPEAWDELTAGVEL